MYYTDMYHFVTVLSSSCPHCDQFYEEIEHCGFVIKKVPAEMDANVKDSLDQCVPLIMCSCCLESVPREVLELLKSSIMPYNWDVLLLCQTGNENQLRCNERVKVIHTDLENGIPVDEVLDWLKTKLPGSPASSVDERQGVINRTDRI